MFSVLTAALAPTHPCASPAFVDTPIEKWIRCVSSWTGEWTRRSLRTVASGDRGDAAPGSLGVLQKRELLLRAVQRPRISGRARSGDLQLVGALRAPPTLLL